ncbi:hypothetical protein MNB_SUP05-5-836 [hydrothermal vent metagenome]|uniref:Methyltransferase FkbM domain-containing protein n=1 Tax=hydrothermal vent metagenome TaxID=652676 RepID=A0A1W1CPA3_9ZZZZ
MLQNIVIKLRKSSFVRNKKLRKLLRKVSNIIARILYGRYKKVSIAKQYQFLLNSQFAFSNYENWGGKHNKGFTKLIELAEEKNIVFDIGAHIGLCALPLSKKINTVYAFECSNINRNYLEQHIKANHIENINVIPFLVGDISKDKVNFFDVKGGSGVPSIANLSEINNNVDAINTSHKQISLDDFCAQNNIIPDVIKIDVEGAEFLVLEGAKKLILKNKPDIVISLHPKHLKNLGRDVSEIFDYCDTLSYQLLSCIDGKAIKKEDLSLDEYYMKGL